MKTLLIKYQDVKYRDFQLKLIHTNYEFIGIRTPILKDFYKKYLRHNDFKLPLDSHESILLKAYWIADQKESFEVMVKLIESHLYYLDNWATTDAFVSALKWIKHNKEAYLKVLLDYLKRKEVYFVRFAIVSLINYYQEINDQTIIFKTLKETKRDEYYIQMALSWLLSYCFVWYFEDTLHFIKDLNPKSFLYQKGIQKALESYRIPDFQKQILKTLKNQAKA